MGFKKSYLVILFLLLFSNAFAEEAALATGLQQIGDFSLSGFGDRGKKSWDLAGESADIADHVVKLKKVVGNHYAEKDNIKLTADTGDFNKDSGMVHLEKNVVVTTASGATLTTNSLDWDRKQQIVSTLDKVNVDKENMNLTGQGAKGQTALNQIVLEKNVSLNINPDEKKDAKKEKIEITCDGPLEIDYGKNIAVFNKNVKVDKTDIIIYSDKMEVYFSQKNSDQKAGEGLMNSSINKIVALGNVRIIRGENISYSQEAVYTALDKKITLTGRPQIVIYQTENTNASFGN